MIGRKVVMATAAMAVLAASAAPALSEPLANNSSTIFQVGDFNNAEVNQKDGANGTSLIEQSGKNVSTALARATVNQSGQSTNDATIQQLATSLATEAYVDQSGEGGVNTLGIMQDGNRVYAGVYQQNFSAGENLISINQSGNDGSQVQMVNVRQVAVASTVRITQTQAMASAGFDIDVFQTGGSNNSATIDQSGDRSVTILSQNGSDLVYDGKQSGADNYSYARLIGINNSAIVDQLSNGNSSAVEIIGSDNEVVVLQELVDDNVSDIYQGGSFNYAKLTQNASAGSFSSIRQIGQNNRAVVSQMVFGGNEPN